MANDKAFKVKNDLDVGGDVTVAGNLTVEGSTISLDNATVQTFTWGDNDKAVFGDGSDLQIYHDGTTSKIDGNVSFTNNVTLSGGTANGVAYLNGSKVLTSGSALTFDGTNLTLNSGYMSFGNNGYIRADSANNQLTFQAGTSGYLWKDSGNSGDWMRLTSTGLTTVNDATIQGVTVGRGAGAVSTNTAVGASALAANTTGTGVVAVGRLAAYSQTSAAYTTAVGEAAAYSTTTGNYNSALGNSALYANTTGSSNVAIGQESLRSNTTASNNTAVGYQAGYSNQTGTQNAFFGRVAGYSNIGSYNVFLGDGAAYNNTSGQFNVAVGQSALISNTTASNNTAVGYQAGYSNTTGSTIDAFGYKALYANTTGAGNSAFGRESLASNTTGSNNAASGNGALAFNTTGNYNTGVGMLALYSNTTASNNTAVGYQAGYSNTTGVQNTYVGYGAGYSNQTGSYSLFVGKNAGQATTGTNNNFVGYGAGYSITTGSKNTILGAYNGNQGGLDIRTSDNNIVLSDGDGNPRWYADGNGTWRTNTAGANGIVLSQDTGNSGATSRLFFTNASATWAILGSSSDLVFCSGGTVGSNTGDAKQVFNQYGIGLGGIAPTSGTGITFPATQNASSNANTLDDYEQGTWTAYLSDGTTSVSLGTQYYTKIGNMVAVRFGKYNTDFSSLNGAAALQLTGLPFAAQNATAQDIVLIGSITSNNPILFEAGAGSAGGYLYQGASGAGIASLFTGDFTGAFGSLWGNFTYLTD